MCRPKYLFANGEGSLIERKRFLVVSLPLSQRGKIMKCFCRMRVLRAEVLLKDGERSLVEWLRLRILALIGIEER